MEPQDVLHLMKANAPSATLADASAFLALCEARGLSPFSEAYPIIMDYTKRSGGHVHSLSIKEHYAVAERWAQQCGGYTIRLREITTTKEGDLIARIGIVSNQDYARVGIFCARIPSADFKEELASFMIVSEARLSKSEMGRRKPPKGHDWKWLVEKRAREGAVIQKFGREPTQARQIYANALAPAEAAEALYGPAPQQALPAPVATDAEIIEGPTEELAGNEPPEEGAKPATPLRPFTPEVLRQFILGGIDEKRDAGFSYGEKSENYRHAVRNNLECCFAGDAHSEQKRHLAAEYLTGFASSKKWDDATIATLHNLLNAKPDDGGVWIVDPLAVTEIVAVAYEAAKEAGQTEMDLA